MERITKRDGLTVELTDGFKFGDFASQNVLHRLAEYEDLEEQGLLIRLPCKVGDTFWEVNKGIAYSRTSHSLGHCIYCLERLGTVCFATKEEAYAKAAELEDCKYEDLL